MLNIYKAADFILSLNKQVFKKKYIHKSIFLNKNNKFFFV